MRALLLVTIILVGGALITYATARVLGLRSGRRRWTAVERVDEDGTLHVGVGRGREFREVKAIPRSTDEIDVLSDIRIAKRDAAELAAELNRRAG